MISITNLFEAMIMKRGRALVFTDEPMFWSINLNIDKKNWTYIGFDKTDLKKGTDCSITFADKNFHDPFKEPDEFENSGMDKSSYDQGTYELKGQFDSNKVDAILIIRGTKLRGQYQLTEGEPSRFLKRKQYTIKKLR